MGSQFGLGIQDQVHRISLNRFDVSMSTETLRRPSQYQCAVTNQIAKPRYDEGIFETNSETSTENASESSMSTIVGFEDALDAVLSHSSSRDYYSRISSLILDLPVPAPPCACCLRCS